MKVRVVPVQDIPSIIAEEWVDSSRKPHVADGLGYVPVKTGYPYEEDLPERKRKGRGFQQLGDVILIHGQPPSDDDLDEITRRYHPRAVLHLTSHEGTIRRPQVSLLSGTPGEVFHREAGIIYHLDPAEVMFSQGNRGEKQRVSSQIRPGEDICDMFAGIGYFTLPLARAGGRVFACEINPAAYRYLLSNRILNHLEDQIVPMLGDCRDLISGLFDRIHMGHFESISFLSLALNHLRPGGKIHLHTLGDREQEIREILNCSGYQTEISIHRVKKAGPCLWHLVYDLEVP